MAESPLYQPDSALRADARALGFQLRLQPTQAQLFDVYRLDPIRKVADRLSYREVQVFLMGAKACAED